MCNFVKWALLLNYIKIFVHLDFKMYIFSSSSLLCSWRVLFVFRLHI